jgi:hypothetical protein
VRLFATSCGIVLLTACSGPAARTVLPKETPPGPRAVEYLATTEDEMGIDVLLLVDVARERTASPVIEALVPRLQARVGRDREGFTSLLGAPKPAFPAALGPLAPAPATAHRTHERDDDRTRHCPAAMLTCTLEPECIAFLRDDDGAGATYLTHRALALLIARWQRCALPFDADIHRRAMAARLVAELEADPHPSDLFFERLAVLGDLGFAGHFDPAWVHILATAQHPDGCYPASSTAPCHPHPTALALWAMTHTPLLKMPDP